MDKIDFVITWVDGNDEEWLKEKAKYQNEIGDKNDARKIRYRDWGTLKYWFRGVEKYAPWVNKIYFITWGHIPKWLNTDNDKLVVVNHKDYIPKEYLPTFNSNAIEMNIFKIKGLSDNFVYFNDDMYITNYVKKRDFFKKGIPCDSLVLSPLIIKPGDGFYKKISNDILIINKYFNYRKCVKSNILKYFNIKYGKYLLKNLSFLSYRDFPGFHNFHFPISYSKNTINEIWNKEKEMVLKTMSFRFRNNNNSINHWLYQYWQFATGKFSPRNPKIGKYYHIQDNKLLYAIRNNKHKLTCIDDSDLLVDFEQKKADLIAAFDFILPDKSQFEKR